MTRVTAEVSPSAPAPVTISVITATLNAQRFLPQCIRSVQGQSGAGFEVEHVIVDGGSLDGTPEIARDSGCLVLEGRDTGVYDALNKGVAVSTGQIINILGADDRVAPGAFATVAGWYHGRRSEWAVGAHEWIDGAGRSLGLMRPPPEWIPRRVFASLGWSCLSHQATYMTRQFFDRLGGFDTTFKIMADYKMLSEALDVQPFDRLSRRLVFGQLHGDNVSADTRSPLFVRERIRIACAYGPPSTIVRAMYRQALRIWLNARSPGWFLRKRMRGVEPRTSVV